MKRELVCIKPFRNLTNIVLITVIRYGKLCNFVLVNSESLLLKVFPNWRSVQVLKGCRVARLRFSLKRIWCSLHSWSKSLRPADTLKKRRCLIASCSKNSQFNDANSETCDLARTCFTRELEATRRGHVLTSLFQGAHVEYHLWKRLIFYRLCRIFEANSTIWLNIV